ncbi:MULTISPECIES: Type II secretory pathway component [unclassified Pseudomonas]|uniref:Type II secretory pathway component n=1 Tax=unclassified Pseudomonas TaxID=196821 RepID=UPI002AC923E7|nr:MULTISPECIES: Type II secretory pathway component [unclassified Pseudomonas]MEB0039936.1 Type II secretory pathway component [Pseudomonas sp. MH10]MEB0078829.1 Type II secretory pathway component [Pseudomonas sp. MH10out]MEB0089734.1 Type II secretory pathway component [Pseudomonas sp. CCI4.2]MEB0102987.1 Type II secretory pathway component [Pseudomonas sp. CCI3.2]MEB0121536.1 Type II secretory pathway component [Pseudomonas sp. CCI1.2]
MFKLLILSALLYSATAQASPQVPIDPTQPPARFTAVRPGEQVHIPVLQEILLGAHGSRAVIDGQTLHVGDKHADARVLAIYPQTVLIERDGKREYLRLVNPVLQPSR